jgi:hypothetical protein
MNAAGNLHDTGHFWRLEDEKDYLICHFAVKNTTINCIYYFRRALLLSTNLGLFWQTTLDEFLLRSYSNWGQTILLLTTKLLSTGVHCSWQKYGFIFLFFEC